MGLLVDFRKVDVKDQLFWGQPMHMRPYGICLWWANPGLSIEGHGQRAGGCPGLSEYYIIMYIGLLDCFRRNRAVQCVIHDCVSQTLLCAGAARSRAACGSYSAFLCNLVLEYNIFDTCASGTLLC